MARLLESTESSKWTEVFQIVTWLAVKTSESHFHILGVLPDIYFKLTLRSEVIVG